LTEGSAEAISGEYVLIYFALEASLLSKGGGKAEPRIHDVLSVFNANCCYFCSHFVYLHRLPPLLSLILQLLLWHLSAKISTATPLGDGGSAEAADAAVLPQQKIG
jgi:hypothetical protein